MSSNSEVCDFCEEVKPIKFGNLTRGFCSVDCANAYLKGEGFSHRICINCERANVYGGQLVCDKCLEKPSEISE